MFKKEFRENILKFSFYKLIFIKFYCTLIHNLLFANAHLSFFKYKPTIPTYITSTTIKRLLKPLVCFLILYNKTLYSVLSTILGIFKKIYFIKFWNNQPYGKPVLLAKLTAFLQYISVTKSRSINTVRNAKSIISRFIIFLINNYDTAKLTEITTPILLKFLEDFNSPSYRYTVIYYLRQFFDFLKIQNNPAREIKFPKINPCAKIKFLEKHDTIRLIKTVKQRVDSGKNIREYAIIQLILFTGLRADEVLNLKKQDILGSGIILIRDSKTHESRVVKVPQEVLNAISNYHKTFPQPDNPYVFYANNRKTNKPLCYASLRTIIKDIFISAGINEKGVNLHALRHTFARTLVQGGISREEIQKFLGHKNLKTTEIYTRLYDEDIIKRASKVHKLIQKEYGVIC